MNVENLLKVKALILEEPKRLDMGRWLVHNMDQVEPELRPACGTVACIAGWGAVLSVQESNHRIKKLKTAAEYVTNSRRLGIEYFEISELQADDLFRETKWPEDLWRRIYRELAGSPEYAEITAETIDRFIACNGNWADDKAEG